MNRISRLLVLAAFGCGVAAPLPLFACGPFFPPSYFDNGKYYREYSFELRPNITAELALIGRHYYPEWAGRQLRHNTVKTAQAHRLDFFSAAQAAGLSAEAAEAPWQRYQAFAADCVARCQAGTPPAIPDDAGVFLEFYLYTLGRGEFMARPDNLSPEAWERLLALEPTQRHYRSSWVKFMQVLAQPDYNSTDAALTDFRRTLDAGFADTAGLEESVIRQLVRRDPYAGFRYYPVALTALAPDEAFLAELRHDFGFWSSPQMPKKRPRVFADLLLDRVGREILTVCQPELALLHPLPPEAQTAILTADRQAWRLFHAGNFDAARKLLLQAPETSLIRLYLEARFARMDGDYETSARALRRFLEIYRERGNIPEGFQCDAATLPELVAGELGSVRVLRRDFQEALYGFLLGNSWLDAAVVAERLLTVEELVTFVEAHPDIRFAASLRHLLARRLMRHHRPGQAEPYFPEPYQLDCRRYRELSEYANNPTHSRDDRALALYHLARLMFACGMELSGTELEPDNFINEGHYPWSGLPDNWGNPSMYRLPAAGVKNRFHYRNRAAGLAARAAMLAEDPDLKVAALWLGGMPYQTRAPEEQESFYHALCDLTPHPAALQAREAGWIPIPVQNRMLRLRHHPDAPTLAEIRQLVAELTESIP